MGELSMRDSRVEKDNLDDDSLPEQNEMIHAYVVSTTKMGCFVRLSRSVEGRVILKELSDEYLPNPGAMFPQGRLVVGKVKSVNQQNYKFGGVITRVESYGVFIRIDNSDISGLAHV